jgi:methyl-accepting chemotaxis protein
MADRMEAAVEQFQALERAIASHVGHLRLTGDTITSAGNAFGTISAQLRQTAEPVATALTAVEASARQAADTLRLATTSHDTMLDAARHLTEVSTSATAAFDSYRQRFQDTDKALGETVGGLIDGSIQLADRFSKIVNELDDHLGDAVGKLRMGIGEIREMVRDLTESAVEIRSVVPNLGVAAQ